MQRKVTWVGLLQAAAVLTVAFSFATAVDIPHRNIELFTHFRLQYLVVSALLLIAFALLRSPGYSAALLLTFVLNATFIWPWYFSTPPASSGAEIKIVHANVHSSNSDYQRLLDFIADEDPDIIFLQEVTNAWVSGTSSLLQTYPHSYAEPRQGNFGIAMYSKIPLSTVRHIDSPPFGHPTIVAEATIDGSDVTLISSHPTIPIGASLYSARNEQMHSLIEITNSARGKIVLLGDFNSSIWDSKFKLLERESGLVNARRGFGVLPSWPTFMPFAMIPIDHALVSKDIGVADIRTGKSVGSDHLPLIVTLTL